MDIKKRFSSALLTLILLFQATACQFPGGFGSGLINPSISIDEGENSDSHSDHNHNSTPEPHLHTYSKEWSSNASYHWHDATCGHNVKQDYTAHAFGNWEEVVEATEYQEGLKQRTCEVCGYLAQQVINKKPHTHSYYYNGQVDATCTSGGYDLYTCDCGASKKENVTSPLGHDLIKEQQYDEEYHWNYSYCTRCDYSKDSTHKSHILNEEVINQPTEISEGLSRFYCSSCSYETIKATSKLDHSHNFSTEQRVEVTCETDGYVRHYCDCGVYVEVETLPALGHDYNEEYVCNNCGKYYYTEGLEFELINDGTAYTVSAYKGEYTEIIVPSYYNGLPVVEIKDRVFFDCQTIMNVVISEGITSIGDYAFENCQNLVSVSLPESLKIIGDGAFYWCGMLSDIQIPSGVKEIGGYAFNSCSSLEVITIPNGVTSIYDYTFCGCGFLRTLIIPTSVTYIGEGALEGCNCLVDVYYLGNEKQWNSIMIVNYEEMFKNIGVMCNFDHQHSYVEEVIEPTCEEEGYTIYTCECGDTYQDNYVDALGHDLYTYREYTFEHHYDRTLCNRCDYMESTDPVEHNFDYVLITEATCEEDGLEMMYCDGCDYEMEHPLLALGHDIVVTFTFYAIDSSSVLITCANGCGKSEDYTEHLQMIIYDPVYPTCEEDGYLGSEAFIEYEGQMYIDTYSETLPALGHDYNENNICNNCGAEYYTEGLIFHYDVAWDAYFVTGYQGIDSNVIIPSKYHGLPVIIIQEDAFKNCSIIESISIPETITTIGYGAFVGTSLTELTIPKSVTSIGRNIIDYDTKIETLSIPFIGASADDQRMFNYFYDNDAGHAMNYPSSIKTIKVTGDYETLGNVFYYVGGIGGIELVEIAGSITIIDDSTFEFGGATVIDLSNITEIRYHAFYYAKLDTLILGDDLVKVDDDAFEYASVSNIYYKGSQESFANIFYNIDVTNINVVCNYNPDHEHSYLEQVIEPTCEEQGYTVYSCECGSKYKDNYVDALGHNYNEEYVCDSCEHHFYTEGLEFTLNEQQTEYTVASYNGTDLIVVIPAIYNGLPVTRLRNDFLRGYYEITNVVIPDSVRVIGSNAFNGCYALTNIVLPDGVITIEKQAFYSCGALTSIIIPTTVTYIGEGAFDWCDSLVNVYYLGSEQQWNSIMFENYEETFKNIGVIYDYGHEHSYVEEVIEPTCEEQGYTVYSCECGDTYKDNYVDALGHTLYTYKEYTDTHHYDFTICHNCTYEKSTEPVEHNLIDDVFNEPTCEEDGEARVYCDSCEYEFNHPIPALGHDYNEEYVCNNCGNYYYTEGLEYVLNEQNTEYTVTAYNGTDSIVVIPAIYNGLPVTTIQYLTSYNESMEKLVIGNNISYIQTNALCATPNLQSIYISSSVSKIDNGAFTWMAALNEIIVDENNHVYDSRENCNAIIETESNTLILGCTSTIIPNDVEVIGARAFEHNDTLSEIVIPDSVTRIEYNSFWFAFSLKTVILGKNVNYIASNAFADCSAIVEVNYAGSQEQWNSITIEESGNDALKNANIVYNYVEEECSHQWSLTEMVLTPTCEEGGEYIETCSLCNETRNVLIDALGHDYNEEHTCSLCGKTDDAYSSEDVILTLTNINGVSEYTILETDNGFVVELTVVEEWNGFSLYYNEVELTYENVNLGSNFSSEYNVECISWGPANMCWCITNNTGEPQTYKVFYDVNENTLSA